MKSSYFYIVFCFFQQFITAFRGAVFQATGASQGVRCPEGKAWRKAWDFQLHFDQNSSVPFCISGVHIWFFWSKLQGSCFLKQTNTHGLKSCRSGFLPCLFPPKQLGKQGGKGNFVPPETQEGCDEKLAALLILKQNISYADVWRTTSIWRKGACWTPQARN